MQRKLLISHRAGAHDIFRIPCVSIDQHLLGIHILPNQRKTSTQIPCKDNQLSRVSTILTSFVYHAMQDVSSKMINAAPTRGMLAPYPSYFPWSGQLANQPQNLSRIIGRWQSFEHQLLSIQVCINMHPQHFRMRLQPPLLWDIHSFWAIPLHRGICTWLGVVAPISSPAHRIQHSPGDRFDYLMWGP